MGMFHWGMSERGRMSCGVHFDCHRPRRPSPEIHGFSHQMITPLRHEGHCPSRPLPVPPPQFVRHEDVLKHADSKAWLARLVQKYGLKVRSSELKRVVKYKTSVSRGSVSFTSWEVQNSLGNGRRQTLGT